jgi:hypothetical protein
MKSKVLALFLGWLVPGVGHLYAGKRQKAVIFFVAIMAAAFLGLVLGSGRNVYFRLNHYQFYAEIGNGLFTVVASVWMFVRQAQPIESTASAGALAGIVPIADLYLMVAGLLNAIVAANAFDTVAAEARRAK